MDRSNIDNTNQCIKNDGVPTTHGNQTLSMAELQIEHTSSHNQENERVQIVGKSADHKAYKKKVNEENPLHKDKMSHWERWEVMFSRLIKFKQENGHCMVPNRYSEDRQLGIWVATQRRCYKAFTSGKRRTSCITPERAYRLTQIGFDWLGKERKFELLWETQFKNLLEYVIENGQALVPVGWKRNPQLGNWISNQRQEYKSVLKGKESSLTAKRIDLLNSIGFVWEAPVSGLGKAREAMIESNANSKFPRDVRTIASNLLEGFKSISSLTNSPDADNAASKVLDAAVKASPVVGAAVAASNVGLPLQAGATIPQIFGARDAASTPDAGGNIRTSSQAIEASSAPNQLSTLTNLANQCPGAIYATSQFLRTNNAANQCSGVVNDTVQGESTRNAVNQACNKISNTDHAMSVKNDVSQALDMSYTSKQNFKNIGYQDLGVINNSDQSLGGAPAPTQILSNAKASGLVDSVTNISDQSLALKNASNEATSANNTLAQSTNVSDQILSSSSFVNHMSVATQTTNPAVIVDAGNTASRDQNKKDICSLPRSIEELAAVLNAIDTIASQCNQNIGSSTTGYEQNPNLNILHLLQLSLAGLQQQLPAVPRGTTEMSTQQNQQPSSVAALQLATMNQKVNVSSANVQNQQQQSTPTPLQLGLVGLNQQLQAVPRGNTEMSIQQNPQPSSVAALQLATMNQNLNVSSANSQNQQQSTPAPLQLGFAGLLQQIPAVPRGTTEMSIEQNPQLSSFAVLQLDTMNQNLHASSANVQNQQQQRSTPTPIQLGPVCLQQQMSSVSRESTEMSIQQSPQLSPVAALQLGTINQDLNVSSANFQIQQLQQSTPTSLHLGLADLQQQMPAVPRESTNMSIEQNPQLSPVAALQLATINQNLNASSANVQNQQHQQQSIAATAFQLGGINQAPGIQPVLIPIQHQLPNRQGPASSLQFRIINQAPNTTNSVISAPTGENIIKR